MGKTSCKKGQYYCNTDKKCKPIPDGYEVREDGFLVKEGWSDKYKKSIDCDNPKGFSQKAHCAGKKKKMTEESNPRIARKKGQPAKSKKHSDLYTDEDPKGTIHGLGFKDVATAKASVAKIRKSSRSHAHKIQAAIAMEQRARVMGKTAEAAVYRKFINSMKKKTKRMNEEKHGDHEPEMIRSQLKTASRASKRIEKHSRKKENFKAWVQSKITKASDYLDTAADYLDGKDDVKEGSLHKWFKGSKSKDGKGGWVNVVTGGTCASDEPGEGTPKCVSSAKRASMSKKERLSAARRKKKADPNQQSKRGAAKPTYVSTDKPKKKKKMKEEFISLPLQLEVPQNDGEFRLGLMFRESLEKDRGMLFVFENTDRHSFHMKNTFIPLDIAFINEEGIIESIKELNPMSSIPVYPDGKIRYAVEVNRGWFAENGVVVGDTLLEDTEEAEIDLTEVKDKKGKGSGTKDACYHKVKSRYSVWPSAYASGALVKCRKVGAANWGNSRKEEVEYEAKVYKTPHYRWRDEIVEHHKKDADGNTIPHENEDIQEMDGKLMPSNPNFKGVGATKKSNPFPGGKQKARVFTQSQSMLVSRDSGKVMNTNLTPKEYAKKNFPSAETTKKELKKTYDKEVPYYDSQGPSTLTQLKGKEGKFVKIDSDLRNFNNKRVIATAGKGSKDKDKYSSLDYSKGSKLANIRKKEVNMKDHYDWRETLDEKCWKGYEKKGMKTMFGKRYPNCVKKTKKEEFEVETSSLDEKLVHGAFGNYIKGQKLPKNTEKKYKEPPYKDLAASNEIDGELTEKTMTPSQKRKDTMLKKKYDDSDMKKNMIAQYGKEEGTKIYFAKIRKEAMKTEETAIENELLIQDWNTDDIKFTEIETVDIIKAKPLKEKASIDEGFKKKIIKKVAKQIIKQFTKKKPKVTKSMIDSGVTKYKPVDKVTSQNIQTKSIINQTKKANELANKPNKGTTPVKVNLQKKIDFDKYIGGSSTPIKKKFVEKRPTGTFTDDLPPVKTEPLTQTQKNKIKKIQKNIDKNKKNNKEDKPNLMSSYDWRTELGEDWQKVNRKDKTDGLSKKAVKAYRRENPGSKLKTAVTKDPKKLKKGSKDAKRRLSFCRRMKGMKKRLTSAKTARDPDSRINKALRRWNC